MKQCLAILVLILGFQIQVNAHRMIPLGATIQFANLEEGQSLLSTEDDYTNKWSPFDIQSRLQDKEGTKQELLKFAASQVIAWTVEEEQKIRLILGRIDSIIRVKNYFIPLPRNVFLVKSTLLEEGGANGYTRENYIVLRQDLIFRDDDQLQKIILHEIFHILTRNDPDYREKLYDIIGFTVSNEIPYPEILQDLRLTNPDAHSNDSYISLTNPDGQPIDVVMILYGEKPWESGLFFQSMKIGFLEIEGDAGEKSIRYRDNQPSMYSIDEVRQFFEQVGRNTQYIIDPEEILADNFSYVFADGKKLADPEIVSAIEAILKVH